MSIRFRCPSCGAIHGINERAIGRNVRCRDCHELVRVAPYTRPPAEVEALGPDDLEIIEEEFPIVDESDAIVIPAADLPPITPRPPRAPPVIASPPVAAPPVVAALPAVAAVLVRTRGKLLHDRAPMEAEMDMTPMVDVTFQLLIFFMLTASFAMQKSLSVPKPASAEPSANTRSVQDFQENPDYVVVRVDGFNTFHVSASVWTDEIEAPSEQELLVKLRQAKKGDERGNVPTRMLVVASGEALHERVVTAIDAGNEVGMEEVQLVTVEDDQ